MIPYGRHNISERDVEAVVEVLRSDFLTQGPVVPRFEKAIADLCGVPHAVAVNSATSALHIACLALGVGPQDWVWTSPITFVASANCARYCGARVDFVDIDPRTYNLCPQALEAKLIEAQRQGCLPKVVIPVHLCGAPCDMQAIFALSQRFGFRIIEDASHAIGATYQNHPVGGCRYSDITVFSFHPVKIVTTGEGGMALCRSAELAARMMRLRSHGVTRDAALMTHEPDGPWYYQQIDLGFNYRMTDIQAALGLSQVQRLPEFIDAREAIARRYDEMLADLPLVRPWVLPEARSALHLYVVRVDECGGRGRGEVFEALLARGISPNVHYIPVHTQPYYRDLGFKPGDFPQAERYYREAISLPIYPDLDEQQQAYVVDSLRAALG